MEHRGNSHAKAALERDVEALRARVAELEGQARLLGLAQNVVGVGTWVWRVDADRVEWDAQVSAILGIDADTPPTADLFDERVHPDDREIVRDIRRNIVAHGTVAPTDCRIVQPGGATRYVRIASSPYAPGEDKPAMIVGIMLDLTESRQAEATQRQQKELLETVFNFTPFGLIIKDRDSRIRFVNQFFADNFGVDADAMVGQRVEEVPELVREMGPERVAMLAAADEQVIASGERLEPPVDHRLGQDGRTHWIRRVKAPYMDADGAIQGTVTLTEDVTERKIAEDRLRDSQHVLQTIFDTVPHALFMKDRDRRYIMANRALAGLYGLQPEDVIGRLAHELPGLTPEEDVAIRESDEAVLQRGERVEIDALSAVSRQGQRQFLRMVKLPVRDGEGRIVGLVGSAENITEQLQTAAERDRQQALLSTIISRIPMIVWATDRKGVFTLSEGQGLKRQGLEPGEAVGRSLFELYADAPDFIANVRRALAGEEFHAINETRGAIYERWFVPARDDAGEVDGLIGVSVDVTEREQALVALKASEKRFRELTDRLPDSVFEVDLEGTITYANSTALDTFGFGEADLATGLNCMTLLVPEERERGREHLAEIVSGADLPPTEFIAQRMDGSRLPIVVRAIAVQENGQQVGGRAIVTDFTRHKEIEGQLRQAQKMEAVGQLAGGVAHDFNNLLQIVQGYAQLATQAIEQSEPDKALRDLERVQQASSSAADLTRQLLAFSRQQTLRLRNVDLNQVIAGIMKMLGRLLGETIELKLKLDRARLPVNADPGALEQVLLNLCVNARDAMPSGGLLEVSTARVATTTAFRSSHPEATAPAYALVSVRDTGVGMNAEVLQHAFEPFFSTKEIGKGTGLGLAIVHGIVRQHAGFVDIESEPGAYTRLRVYLPLAERASAQAPAESTAEPPRGEETVLIAEDNEAVRELIVGILRDHGYRVVATENGEEAVREAQHCGAGLALVILDAQMPKLDGAGALAAIRALRPDVPALLCSGYEPDTPEFRRLRNEGVPLIRKPFSPAVLLQAVRTALDAARQPTA